MAEFTILISTKLRARDPSAATVKEVLTHDMGWGGAISGVGREDLWEIDADAKDKQAALVLAEELARKTWIFYNPNKHILSLKIKDEAAEEGPVRESDFFSIPVKTRFLDDEKERSALRFLRETFKGAESIKRIKKFTMWHLELNFDSLEEARKAAGEIAVNTSILSGLLANPSSQEVETG